MLLLYGADDEGITPKEHGRIAETLSAAKVEFGLHVYPGAYHAFQFVGDTTVSRRFRRDCRDALNEALRAS